MNSNFNFVHVEVVFRYIQLQHDIEFNSSSSDHMHAIPHYLRLSHTNGLVVTNEHIINQFVEHYSLLKPVYLFLKSLFASNSLTCPESGGLDSLSLVLMIVSLIQEIEFKNLDDPPDTPSYLSSAEHLIIHFIHFYAFTFNYRLLTVCPHPPSFPSSSSFKSKNSNDSIQLEVINVFNKSIVITKSFKKTSDLIQILKLEYNRLFESCVCKSTLLNHSIFKFDQLTLFARSLRSLDTFASSNDKRLFALSFEAQSKRKLSDIHHIDQSTSKKKKKLSLKSCVFDNVKEDANEFTIIKNQSDSYHSARMLFGKLT